MSAPARPRRSPASRFAPLSRIWAMLVKEFIQLLRDRVTLATMVSVPLMQLFLFGFAINTTPRHMPAGVLLQEQSDVGRSVLEAMQHTDFFDFKLVAKSEAEIAARIRQLREDQSAWRRPGDTGQFSLAGAQPKTALLLQDGRWGVPSGRIPTTHILKPPSADFDGHAENEHF